MLSDKKSILNELRTENRKLKLNGLHRDHLPVEAISYTDSIRVKYIQSKKMFHEKLQNMNGA